MRGWPSGNPPWCRGGNEITAARARLETLCLQGGLVTADAIHTQTDTAALILERGGDQLFALKGEGGAATGSRTCPNTG